MEAADQNVVPVESRVQRWTGEVWRFLRSPRLTAGCLVLLVLVGAVGWLLPQQSGAAAEGPAWIARLPAWLQPWGDLLFWLDFGRLFESIWWWGPVGLLLLNSLIALADYWPGTRRRLGRMVPPLSWQHPLARREEEVVRLPKTPDAFLSRLEEALQQQGYFVYLGRDEEERLVGAVRRRWAWLGVPALYAGLVLLAAALFWSHYGLQTERLRLDPFAPQTSRLLEGPVELQEMGTGRPGGQVLLSRETADESVRVFTWQLFQPGWLRGTLVWPLASEPVLTVEVREPGGNLRRLIPIEEDLEPAERLHLPLRGTEERLIFLVPRTNLAVQIGPGVELADNEYNLQVRREAESSPSINRTVAAGEPVEIEGLTIDLSLNRNLELLLVREPALPVYGLALLLGLGGGLVAWLWPPQQVWLAPEVKGIGGRLYGIREGFGPRAGETEFLEGLLALAATEREEEGE